MGFQWFRGSAEGDAHLLLSRRPARHGVCGTATLLNERSVQLDTIIYLASPYYTMFLHLFIFSHSHQHFYPFHPAASETAPRIRRRVPVEV